jgi:transglutaminase-like putative cysteine protease
MTATKSLFTILLLVATLCCVGQKVTDTAKKTTQKSLRKEAVINSEEDLKKFMEEWRQDSIKLMEEWKKQFELDSVKLVEQANKDIALVEKTYQERWNPADSLKYIDDKVKSIFNKTTAGSLEDVIATINKNFTKPLHKARAVFYWIATNIKYDWDAYSSGKINTSWDYKKDALQTFNSRTGVCDHYSSLFQYMAEQCGLEVKKITGHGKVWPDARVNTSRSDHTWNAVKINGKWKLMDVTWASEKNEDIEYFWFDTPAEKFIYSHFPSDTAEQFLKNKTSIDEFAQWPIISKYLFVSKANVTIPSLGYYANTSGVFELELKSSSSKYKIEVEVCRVTFSNEKRFTGKESWQKLPVNVVRGTNDSGKYNAMLPGKGPWWIKVNILEKTNLRFLSELEFPSCMIFQVGYL